MELKNQKSQSNQLKTAVIYARYSSENQNEQSIDGQLRVCQEYAKVNNIIILDTYIDRAMTGTNDNRPAFQQMIADSKHKKWDYVLVYKLDRFSRNKYESAIHKHTLKENGVKVKSATEMIPDSPEGILIEAIHEGYAEYYSAELSQKVRRGMNETRLKGNFTGGYVPYGYVIVNKKVTIDEEKAEVVRFIYEQYSLGVYVKDIMNTLNAKGIYNRGKPFARNTVYKILKTEKYSGVYRYKGQVFTNIYPQIVPTDIFEIVRDKMQKNKKGSRSPKIVYIFRQKAFCGKCGQPISAECGTSCTGDKRRYYKCYGRKNRNGCKQEVFTKELLEETVLDSLITELKKPKVMNTIIKGILDLQNKNFLENAALKMLLSEKKKVEKSLDNLVTAIENGVVSNTTNRRLHELEAKLSELEEKIAIEENKSSKMITEKKIRDFYEMAIKFDAQAMISILIEKIVITDRDIVIYYNKPNSNICPDESQGFCFLETERNGFTIEMYI